jgi:hypothetical protein
MAEQTGFSLSGAFKKAASFIFNKHTLIHGALMLGMVFPAVAAAAAAAETTATLGDLALGAVDMVGAMFSGLGESVNVLGDVASNSLSGEFAAASYEMGAHAVHAGAEVSAEFVNQAANQWGVDAGQMTALMRTHP